MVGLKVSEGATQGPLKCFSETRSLESKEWPNRQYIKLSSLKNTKDISSQTGLSDMIIDSMACPFLIIFEHLPPRSSVVVGHMVIKVHLWLAFCVSLVALRKMTGCLWAGACQFCAFHWFAFIAFTWNYQTFCPNTFLLLSMCCLLQTRIAIVLSLRLITDTKFVQLLQSLFKIGLFGCLAPGIADSSFFYELLITHHTDDLRWLEINILVGCNWGRHVSGCKVI